MSQYSEQVQFFTATVCYQDARRHLPAILEKQGLPSEPFLAAIDTLTNVVIPLEEEIYAVHKEAAIRRIQERDIQDWPLIALSLTLNCPLWTEDNDFFRNRCGNMAHPERRNVSEPVR
ncbi:MAG: PIN domain-containing protein [Caldilineaceae bacterium]